MFVSPAAFSILLGAALVVLFWARIPLRFPQPTRLPLLCFLAGTLIASVVSPEPLASWPQVKKFWVFLAFAVLYSVLRRTAQVYRVWQLWALCGSVTALWSFVQFLRKWEAASRAHTDFYAAYVAARVTGLRDHWMTFSGEQMIVVLMILALLLFGPRTSAWWWLILAFALVSGSLVISLTRGVWLATVVGLVYLVGVWRWRLLPIVPAVLIVVALASPAAVRERIVSFYSAHGDLDSNMHRIYVWRTGLEMVRAHPWLGIGPSEVQKQFDNYMPPDLPKKKPEGFYGHLHNIYLQYAAERGVPTLLTFLWFILGSAFVFARALQALPPRRGVARSVLQSAIAVTLGVLTEGFFETNLADSEVLVMYLAVVAMGYIIVDAQSAGPDPAPVGT